VSDKDIGQKEYLLFCKFLERQCGIVLGDNKQYLVRSRLTPLLNRFSCSSLSQFLADVNGGKNLTLTAAVIEAMTTNETLWFRDVYPFELLKNEILDKYAKRRTPLKIWSAACSSGQEPYSIAMSILEYQKKHSRAFSSSAKILGTDISREMLSLCEAAEYDLLSLSRGLSELHKRDYFDEMAKGRLKIKANVRAMTSFKSINLMDNYQQLGRFDIIFCRNVLIYFSAEFKKQILQKIAASLQDDGILFLGASESLSGLSSDFKMVRSNPGLYYVKKQVT
jgi:chemotaxis protein methyltransferase CheR